MGRDDDLLEPGDVIISILERPLHGTVIDLMALLERNKRKPISIEVAKVRKKDGTLYLPIVRHLLSYGLKGLLRNGSKQQSVG